MEMIGKYKKVRSDNGRGMLDYCMIYSPILKNTF